VLVVDVEARELDEGDPLVQPGIGLTAEDFDGVPQVHEGLGEVTGVDALTTHVGLSPVAEIGDAQGRVGRHVTRWAFRSVD
jgi:hypothetical protein